VSYKVRDEVSNLRNRSFWLEKKSKPASEIQVEEATREEKLLGFKLNQDANLNIITSRRGT
jgi:hypothetical protein